MLDQLERAEKSVREKENLCRVAREEARALTSEATFKEQEIKRLKEALEAKEKQMQTVTARSDCITTVQ